jgi:hypothetical protein
MWTNGTGIVAGHHYVLLVVTFFEIFAESFAYNLAKYWAGKASSSLDMASPGNGATLNSITVR